MKKILIVITVIALLVFSACGIEQENEDSADDSIYEANQDLQGEIGDVVEFTVIIQDGIVDPETINVGVGDFVRLDIVYVGDKEDLNDRNKRDDFAFTIPGIEVEEISYENGMIFYEFVANKAGVYDLVCTNGCVPGMTSLDLRIVVE
ncbi:hypothetical protein K9L97_04805 [Candidatus Woesearchaeota archaeon]|nr:hypothetical protein [Candidatus Woesearchaeota archaeon]